MSSIAHRMPFPNRNVHIILFFFFQILKHHVFNAKGAGTVDQAAGGGSHLRRVPQQSRTTEGICVCMMYVHMTQ